MSDTLAFAAPETIGLFLTPEQAAAWIGIDKGLFAKLVKEIDPKGLWLVPTYFGRKKTWTRERIVLFAAIYRIRQTTAPPPRAKTKEK